MLMLVCLRFTMALKVKRGDLIISSKPFAFVLCSENIGQRCDGCLERNEKLLRCTKCRYAHYCNKICQKLSWTEHNHKEECNNIVRIAPRTPTDFLRLVGRVVVKLQAGGQEEQDPLTNRTFKDLQSHESEILKDPNRLEQLVVISRLLKEYLGSERFPSPAEFPEIFGKITVNSFSICDDEMQPIGVGIYLGPSIINHSCQPNATAAFHGITVNIYATTEFPGLDLSKVFISYIDILATTEERRKSLREQYYFDCECPRCLDVNMKLKDACRVLWKLKFMVTRHETKLSTSLLYKLLVNLNELMSSISCSNASCLEPQVLSTALEPCKGCGGPGSSPARIQQAKNVMTKISEAYEEMKTMKKENNILLEKCDSFLLLMKSILHRLNISYVRVLDLAFDACMDKEQWEKASTLGSQTLQAYRKYYGPSHPNLGIQLFKLGKISLFLHQLETAEMLLAEAAEVLQVTHSTNHPLYKSLITFLSQCLEEMAPPTISSE